MKKIKHFIVWFLPILCDKTHWLTWRAPLRWIMPVEYLALLSYRLDERWNTGIWTEVPKNKNL